MEAQKLLPNATGTMVYWKSKEGIFVGTGGGEVKNLTWHKWKPIILPNRTSAIFRNDRGCGQYVCVYELPEIPTLSISGRFPVWAGITTIS